MEQITALIGQMGWPIASCVLVMWFAYQLVIRGEAERKEEREAHRREMDAVTQAVNACTQAIADNTIILKMLEEKLNA